jgi:hypothetical protein
MTESVAPTATAHTAEFGITPPSSPNSTGSRRAAQKRTDFRSGPIDREQPFSAFLKFWIGPLSAESCGGFCGEYAFRSVGAG